MKKTAPERLIETLGEGFGDDENIEHLRDLASEVPVIRMVNLIISRAVESRSSDIHIEPFEKDLRLRYRVDGVLQNIDPPPNQLRAAIISRIKLMAKLNIAETALASGRKDQAQSSRKRNRPACLNPSHDVRRKRRHAHSGQIEFCAASICDVSAFLKTPTAKLSK